jgi:UDP-4-amino-4,6-dideoxy-N-acetyl-beta-L-altrosamine transaminase
MNPFKKSFPYGKHFLDQSDINSVIKVLKSPALTQGPKIYETEKYIANYVGSKYAVLVSSCTAGLHISYKALNLSSNSKTILSPITFVSTANASLYCGSKVIFSDIDENSVNLSSEILQKVLKKKSNVKCIMPVHFGGVPCDMKKINLIAKKNKIKIIEDAAHAMGAKYNTGEKVGSCKYSDLTVFSFHPVKIIAGGEGGIVTTNSKKLYLKLLEYRSHGISKNSNEPFINKQEGYSNGKKNIWFYEMKELGFHYRQTDIHSALILSQMKKINKFIKTRYNLAKKYDFFFKKHKNVKLVQEKFRKLSSNHLYVIKILFSKLKINRNDFMIKLRKLNIVTQVHYIPLPYHPYYKKKKYNLKECQVAKNYYEECLSIPLYYGLKFKEQKFIMKSISDIILKNS